MFDITMTTRHRVHQVSHGPGKGKGSGIGAMIPLSRTIHGGSDSNEEMNQDLGDGRRRSGTNGRIVHGPALGRPGLGMTVVDGTHIIQAATRDLQIGGSEKGERR